MPNRDKTGPLGKGPKTGRSVGPCKEPESNEENGQPFGFGKFRRGFRRGFRGKRFWRRKN